MKVAVVGGGLGGLAAAYRLAAGGVEVTVFEAEARAGGVLGSSRVDGYLREHAATAALATVGGVAELCDELGVATEGASPAAKQRWIWIDGALRALPRGPLDLMRTDLLTWRGKLALAQEPFRPARRLAETDDESVHAWAVRRFGAEVARVVIAPFVTGIYAADAHQVSLAAGFPRLAALEAEGGVVRGLASSLWASGLAGLRRRRGLLAPRGGMQVLVDALARSLGDRVRLGAAVSAVEVGDRDAVITSDGGGVRFDGVVMATPPQASARLLEATMPTLATRLRQLERAPAALVYLGFPRAAVRQSLDGFGFLVARGEQLRALGVVFESSLWSDRAPAEAALFRCIFAGARDPEAFELDDGALIAQATADLDRALGIAAEPTHVSVIRWREGIAQYPVGHGARVAEIEAQAASRRLVLAGASYHGPSLNDLTIDAARVADRVRSWR